MNRSMRHRVAPYFSSSVSACSAGQPTRPSRLPNQPPGSSGDDEDATDRPQLHASASALAEQHCTGRASPSPAPTRKFTEGPRGDPRRALTGLLWRSLSQRSADHSGGGGITNPRAPCRAQRFSRPPVLTAPAPRRSPDRDENLPADFGRAAVLAHDVVAVECLIPRGRTRRESRAA